MKSLIINKIFGIGFLIGVAIVFLLNIYLPIQKLNFADLLSYYGFPFSFYRVGYGEGEGLEQIKEILWFGLVGDLLFALLISSLAGISLRFLADNKLSLK